MSRLAYELGLQLQGLESKRILVAFSGGLDSCVLLELLLELKGRNVFELGVAHIHHGDENCSEMQKKYRDEALEFSMKRAALKNCEFFFEKYDSIGAHSSLKNSKQRGITGNSASEASLRNIRSELLEKIRVEINFDLIAYAHHAQDLFETRLIRFMRGTGPRGLRAMSAIAQTKIRPILKLWPREILAYADQYQVHFLTDPSNLDSGYLRNWIRRDWLPDLERKRPGSVQAFARSIELLSNQRVQATPTSHELPANQAVINREKFKILSKGGRAQIIADYLAQFAKKNYSSNMVQEICKRLDSPQKQLTFIVAGLEWTVNARQIQAREVN